MANIWGKTLKVLLTLTTFLLFYLSLSLPLFFLPFSFYLSHSLRIFSFHSFPSHSISLLFLLQRPKIHIFSHCTSHSNDRWRSFASHTSAEIAYVCVRRSTPSTVYFRREAFSRVEVFSILFSLALFSV